MESVNLSSLGLTAEQIEFRRGCLGGSDANIIMSGDIERIDALWRFKRGETDPDDLSDILAVIMGLYTEPLNRAWYEKQTGRVLTDVGAEHISFDNPFMTCTLDGVSQTTTGQDERIYEAKHVNAFWKEEELLAKYVAQLTHNMVVTGIHRADLSAFFGSHKWVLMPVELDDDYARALVEAERRFWHCVETGEAPVAVQVKQPTAPEQMRRVDMTGSNEFADAAAQWLANRSAAKAFEGATKTLKSLVEDDVCEAFGYSVQVKRSKAGALTISEIKGGKK